MAAEDAVAEAVFRHMLTSGHDWSEQAFAACLIVRGRDASASTLSALVEGIPAVKAGSACEWRKHSYVVDVTTGRPAILLRVAFFEWHTGRHVTVNSTYEEANLSAGMYTYDLVRRGRAWVVRRTRREGVA